MTQRIQLPTESWPHTDLLTIRTNSEESVLVENLNSKSISKKEPATVKSVDVSERVAKSEADPRRALLLAKARKKIAVNAIFDQSHPFKRLRLQSGLSQTNLAKAIGSTQAQIAKLESGNTDPRRSTIERLAKAMGVSPLQVFAAFMTSKDQNISEN